MFDLPDVTTLTIATFVTPYPRWLAARIQELRVENAVAAQHSALRFGIPAALAAPGVRFWGHWSFRLW